MRLLIVSPFYKPAYVYGGPTRSVPALCEGMASLGEDVSVFTTNANGDSNFEEKLNLLLDGVSVSYFKRDISSNYFYSSKLALNCWNNIRGYDLVYICSNWGFPLIPASISALKFGVPFIISPRTSFMKITWKKGDIKKWVYHCMVERPLIKKSSCIHYTSEFEKKESEWLNLSKENFVVRNPVPLNDFKSLPPKGIFRSKFNIPGNVPVLIYLGRVEPRKGIDHAIKAFAIVAESFPDLMFVIAGPEEDKHVSQLKSLAGELGIRNKIIFSGFLGPEERVQALVDSDIFILSSLSENFGVSVVEAMAAELPVIISENVGIANEVRSNEVGLVASLNAEAFAKELYKLLSSQEYRLHLGKRARTFSFEYYSPKSVAGQMIINFTNCKGRT